MNLPAFDHGRVLFVAGNTGQALLYTRTGTRQRARPRRFRDAAAALAWCVRAGVPMVWTPPAPDPQKN